MLGGAVVLAPQITIMLMVVGQQELQHRMFLPSGGGVAQSTSSLAVLHHRFLCSS